MPLRTAENLRQLLDGAEGDSVTRGEDQRGHDRGADERGAEEFADAGTLERARRLLLGPDGALGQERPDQDQRQCGNHAGDERVAPGIMATLDRGKDVGKPSGQHICRTHEQATERREGLRPAKHTLTLLTVGKQFGQPGHRRDELHAHPDEYETAEEEQLRKRCGEARCQRGKGIEQDAECEHPPPPEQVGEITADQPEDSTRDRGHEEQCPCPAHVARATRAPESCCVGCGHAPLHQRVD